MSMIVKTVKGMLLSLATEAFIKQVVVELLRELVKSEKNTLTDRVVNQMIEKWDERKS